MAYTSIIAVRHLKNTVQYVKDKHKTSKVTTLEQAVDYALNRDKTEQDIFETSINCVAKNAYKEMLSTKNKYKKNDGVQGYHLVQSFAEGEVTPELAHKIGLEFAERIFGDKYEVVVATHLNTHCYHNHIVCNSVSFVDGKKYHSNSKSYYTDVRKMSDELCLKHGLSVIQNPEGLRGKHNYAKWQAEINNQPTWRTAIRTDIDDAINSSLTWKQFVSAMTKKGYTMRFDRKYATLKPQGKERYVRFKTLGERYTPNAITQRILQPKLAQIYGDVQRQNYRTYEYKPFVLHKNSSLKALYYHYLYLLGAFPKKPHQRVPYALKQDIYKLDKRIAQLDFINDNNIETREQLAVHSEKATQEIEVLTKQRQALYHKNSAKEEIAPITQKLKTLRKEVKMCKEITEHSQQMEQNLKLADEQILELQTQENSDKTKNINKNKGVR